MSPETNEHTEEELANAISQLCMRHSSPIVPGSHIGAHMATRLEPKKFKDIFGPLDAFIETHCPQIQRCGRRGGDFLYTHESRRAELQEANVETQALPTSVGLGPSGDQNRIWRAFSFNFGSSPDRLFVDQSTGRLKVASAEEPIPFGFASVQPMTESEYRALARKFLETNRGSDKPTLQEAIAEDGFWNRFVQLLEDISGKGVKAKLLRFRVKRIHEVFVERLRGVGLEDPVIEKADSYLARRLIPESSADQDVDGQGAVLSERGGMSERELFRAAAEKLGDADLRKVWLPFGAVLDAIRSRD